MQGDKIFKLNPWAGVTGTHLREEVSCLVSTAVQTHLLSCTLSSSAALQAGSCLVLAGLWYNPFHLSGRINWKWHHSRLRQSSFESKKKEKSLSNNGTGQILNNCWVCAGQDLLPMSVVFMEHTGIAPLGPLTPFFSAWENKTQGKKLHFYPVNLFKSQFLICRGLQMH